MIVLGFKCVCRIQDADERKEGIYALDDDTLTICVSRQKGDRPTVFVSKPGSDYILFVLKREGPKDEQKGDKKDKR